MEVREAVPPLATRRDHPNPGRLKPGAVGQGVVVLQDHHVARVAATPIEIARPRGVRPDRLEDFEEFAAHGHDHIGQAEDADRGVAEADLQAEDRLQRLGDGRDLASDQGDLS